MDKEILKKCSFCGKDETEVDILLTGIDGFICNDCIEKAHSILNTLNKENKKGDLGKNSTQITEVPKPVDIKKFLDE